MIIENKSFDEERAFYGEEHITLINCSFDGPADGESALKEAKDVRAEQCRFHLRYPFWHDSDVTVRDSELTPQCRAAFWYTTGIRAENCRLHGIKALRECANADIRNCHVVSEEFGWFCRDIRVQNTYLESQYFMLKSSDLHFTELELHGKYSFQYVQNAVVENARLYTKDAFWHAENVVIKNSVVQGEYLAWYAKNITFDHCKIIGTQPLCYAENVTLIDCEMEEADLCFEKTSVNATVTTPLISIKNPKSGVIYVPKVGEIIMDDPSAKGKIILTK